MSEYLVIGKIKGREYYAVKVVPYGKAKPRWQIYGAKGSGVTGIVGRIPYTKSPNKARWMAIQKVNQKMPIIRKRYGGVIKKAEKGRVYRSLITITDTDHGVRDGVEWRIWVHSERSRITTADLYAKADELQELAEWGGPIPTHVRKIELNEEIDKDMVVPKNASLEEWLAWINVPRARFEFFARGQARLAKSTSFGVMS